MRVGQRDAAIVVRLGVVRPERDCLVVVGDRVIRPLEVREQVSAVVVEQRILRRRCDRLVKEAQSFAKCVHPDCDQPGKIESFCSIGLAKKNRLARIVCVCNLSVAQ